jgi:hypothetical protein
VFASFDARSDEITVLRARERTEKLWWPVPFFSVFLFVSAWICCFMLDSPFGTAISHQPPTKLSATTKTRRSHSK